MSAEQKEMLERLWLAQESLIACVSYKATPGTFLLLFAVCAHGWRFGLGGVLKLARASPRGRRLHGTPLWAPQDHFEPTISHYSAPSQRKAPVGLPAAMGVVYYAAKRR